jgi:hypothetical protein
MCLLTNCVVRKAVFTNKKQKCDVQQNAEIQHYRRTVSSCNFPRSLSLFACAHVIKTQRIVSFLLKPAYSLTKFFCNWRVMFSNHAIEREDWPIDEQETESVARI